MGLGSRSDKCHQKQTHKSIKHASRLGRKDNDNRYFAVPVDADVDGGKVVRRCATGTEDSPGTRLGQSLTWQPYQMSDRHVLWAKMLLIGVMVCPSTNVMNCSRMGSIFILA